MSRSVRLHPEAELELAEAVDHYERERAGLGEAFIRAIGATLNRIAQAPEACSPVLGTRRLVRNGQVHRFPFRVVFVLRSNEDVFVVAVSHTARRAKYWRHRL